MSRIKEQCTYECGPYKAYFGRAEYDEGSRSFHGEVIGTRDVITFQGKTPAELRKAFRDSVDDYLNFCKSLGESPEKPFSGRFVARMSPKLHKTISMKAAAAGKSLNQFVCDCLAAALSSDPGRGSEPVSSATESPSAARRNRNWRPIELGDD